MTRSALFSPPIRAGTTVGTTADRMSDKSPYTQFAEVADSPLDDDPEERAAIQDLMGSDVTKAALRQRRCRARRRAGVQILGVPIDADLVDSLVANGRLSEQETLDRNALAKAVAEAATQGAQSPLPDFQPGGEEKDVTRDKRAR